MDCGRRRYLGKQSSREVLSVDGERPQATSGRDEQMGSIVTGHRSNPPAGGRRGITMMWRHRMLQDLDQQIRDHIDHEIEDNLQRGMSLEEARTAAHRKFGNVGLVKEDARAVWVSIPL